MSLWCVVAVVGWMLYNGKALYSTGHLVNKMWTRWHWGRWLSSNLQNKTRLFRLWNRWSLRCSWSNACRRCSNYIFILDLTPGFGIIQKNYYKTRRDMIKSLGFGATYIWDLTLVGSRCSIMHRTYRNNAPGARIFCPIPYECRNNNRSQ